MSEPVHEGGYRRAYAYEADAADMLITEGWTIVSDNDASLGFDPAFKQHVLDTYFGDTGILQPETYDVFPYDRRRARAVVAFEYSADGHGLTLHDCKDGSIAAKEYHPEKRHYDIVPLMHDVRFGQYLTRLLDLVPRQIAIGQNGPWERQEQLSALLCASLVGARSEDEEIAITRAFLRQTKAGSRGLIGINFFEVFRDVVSGFHQDGVQTVVVDRLERIGGGAVSELRALGSSRTIDIGALQPGSKLIFNDRAYQHTTSRVEPISGETTVLRSLICTIEFESELDWQIGAKLRESLLAQRATGGLLLSQLLD